MNKKQKQKRVTGDLTDNAELNRRATLLSQNNRKNNILRKIFSEFGGQGRLGKAGGNPTKKELAYILAHIRYLKEDMGPVDRFNIEIEVNDTTEFGAQFYHEHLGLKLGDMVSHQTGKYDVELSLKPGDTHDE